MANSNRDTEDDCAVCLDDQYAKIIGDMRPGQVAGTSTDR